MKILVIEDEASIANRLIRLITDILGESASQIIHFEHLEAAQEHLDQFYPDLLFLDLDLSGQDGFDVLRNLKEKSFQTIVVSANTDRALEAFEYGVLDFVPKPFSHERIAQAIQRYSQYSSTDSTDSYHPIPVKRQGKIILISVNDIQHIKGANNYSELHLLDGRRELSDRSMDVLLESLPNHFRRIHKSYILDMNQAETLIKNPGSRYQLRIKNGLTLPLSRTFYKQISSEYFSS